MKKQYIPHFCQKHLVILLIFHIFMELFTPQYAYANIEQVSDNFPMYIIIGLIIILFYCCKKFISTILSKKKKKKGIFSTSHNEHEKICIFSEGKNYWYTFKPIVEAFINDKTSFTYITMDQNDPALAIHSPYMNTRYVGTGALAIARVADVCAALMIATTPNIGIELYMPRPKKVKFLAHVMHSLSDIAGYHKGSVDYYDAVLMGGDFMEESIRFLEKLRNLKAKECISLGIPYLDILAEHVKKKENQSKPPIILIAPSWGDINCFNLCGTQFLIDIAIAGYDIIVRPHPYSYKVEPDVIQAVEESVAAYNNVRFDADMDATNSFRQADLLISDKSSIRFDFALLYERPVITIATPRKDPELFEYGDLGKEWADAVAPELGAIINASGNMDILPLIEKVLQLPCSEFIALRHKYVANFGFSGIAIANWAVNKVKELESKE